MLSRYASWALTCSLLAQTACHEWVLVDPVDATKLGGSYETNIGSRVVAIRVVDVRQPDGRLIELEGKYNIRVTLKNGEEHELHHPIDVQQNGDRLVFRSSNEAPLDVDPDEIARLEAYQHDRAATAGAIVIGCLVGVALIVGLTYAAVSSETANTPTYGQP